MAYAPTLTAQMTATPMPHVTIQFASFAAGTASITVLRQAGGRQMPVRGGYQLAVAGAAGLVDIEAPAVACAYSAEMFDTDGDSLGFTDSTTITPVLPDTWLHNPFDPAAGIAVRVAAATGATVQGQNPVDVYYPVGRRAGVAVGGPRRGLANAAVVVYPASIADADALDSMFGPVNGDLGLPPFLCVRFSTAIVARIRLPQPLFLAVPAPTQTPVNLIAGGHRIGWDISGPEIDPPAAALSQALLRREDINAYYPTRAAFNAAYASRLDANTDYNLAGYAG